MEKQTDPVSDCPSELTQAVAGLTPVQKLALIEHLARSNRELAPVHRPEAQREAARRFLETMEALPVAKNGSHFSGRDHDAILPVEAFPVITTGRGNAKFTAARRPRTRPAGFCRPSSTP